MAANWSKKCPESHGPGLASGWYCMVKMGNVSCVCADMKDTASNELLDVDFDVEQQSGEPLVTDTRIHKVNGAARYTYDADGHRTPVAGAATSSPAADATSTN